VILKLQVVVIADDGQRETCEITSVERKDPKPATLGLTLGRKQGNSQGHSGNRDTAAGRHLLGVLPAVPSLWQPAHLQWI
jgi:hypothetical protein